MMRVQWGLDESHRLLAPLFINCAGMNINDPADHVGRYTLQPTQNIWEFLLLDQDNGIVWQVQWTVEGRGDQCLRIPLSLPAGLTAPRAPRASRAPQNEIQGRPLGSLAPGREPQGSSRLTDSWTRLMIRSMTWF